MAKKQAHAGEPPEGEDLSAAVQVLTQVAQSLAASAQQMMQTMQTMQETMHALAPTPPGAPAAAAPAGQINAWEDDPGAPAADNSPSLTPIKVPVPVNRQPALPVKVSGPSPVPGLYNPGTADFRYWTALEALTRGVNFWGPLLPPGTVWTTLHSPMQVQLVAGRDLNANYSRQFGLRFYQQKVREVQVFSGESPDVTCHELGHAILDAVKPELFDAASAEVAAFHESFGDMSAILSALQLESLRDKVLAETEGHLNVNSRLSRLAEQLGWAIRQLSPTAVDPDCLRNAANRFFYQDPGELPPLTPASQLASEAHSFSRVFTGAFLDALARMLTAVGPANAANLLTVSGHLGQLLVDGVRLASVTVGYYSQVAAAMIQSARSRYNGRYLAALNSGFVQHGILAPSAAVALADAPTPQLVPAAGAARGAMLPTLGDENDGYRRTARDAPELPTRRVVMHDGLTLEVHAPAESARFDVAPAARGIGPAALPDPDEDARAFVEDLVQRGQVDLEPARGVVAAQLVPPDGRSASKKTHTLVAGVEGRLVLKRLHFNCGGGGCSCGR